VSAFRFPVVVWRLEVISLRQVFCIRVEVSLKYFLFIHSFFLDKKTLLSIFFFKTKPILIKNEAKLLKFSKKNLNMASRVAVCYLIEVVFNVIK